MRHVIGFILILLSFNAFSNSNRIDVKTYIPEKAKIYAPVLRQEQLKYWPSHPLPFVFGGLIEQESCLSLTHSRCWDPRSSLKTQREEGAGLGQTTRAYNKDGSIRFDALQEMKNKHPVLSEWNWNNVYMRPDLQISGIVLKSNDDYKTLYMIKDPVVRLHFTDVAYNSGIGNVNNKRRMCGLSKNCDPQLWFDNVEKICDKNAKPIYGTRTACMITQDHTYNVFKVRSEKYKVFFN